MRKPLLIVVLALVMLCSVLADEAQEVRVAVYVLNLGRFDVATGSFTVDFYLSMQCDDACDPSGFEFMNGRATSIDKIIDEENNKFYRIQANLNSKVDLQRFPFDRQKMQIILEDKSRTIDQIRYVVFEDETGIDPSISFTGWNLDGWTAEVVEHAYEVYDETYSQYMFTVNISRIVVNSFMKTFLPVFFITLIVLFSFFLDPDKVTTRLAMSGSSLIGSVMFHISISNQIPPVGYLTFADKFMILTYLILLSSFIISVVLLELQEKKKEKIVQRIHRLTEYNVLILAPILYILLFLVFL